MVVDSGRDQVRSDEAVGREAADEEGARQEPEGPRAEADEQAVDRGPKESITASHSLIPDAMFHSFSAFGAMMAPDLPLQRRQHEMIATMVSVTNKCHY